MNEPLQGQVNLPNDGQVMDDSDIDTPNDNDSTVQQTAAPNDPQQAQQPPIAGAQPPQGPVSQSNPSAGPTAGPTAGPKLPTGPQTPQASVPSAPPVSPIVQKAGMFHEVAEALAGGPRYNYTVDEYGNTVKNKVPVSNAHLALAIAMQALSGAATGLSVPSGPNATGRAAGAAFAKNEQVTQQQDQLARQRASEDFARRAQTTETNLRLYSMARNIGRQDDEANDKYIAQYAPMVKMLQEKYPGYVHGPVKYSDFSKYNVTADSAIPYMRVPRLDENGKQVSDKNGVPQWDIDYLIVDPKFKTTGMLTPEVRKSLSEMGMNFANNDMINNTPLEALMGLNLTAKAASWENAKDSLGTFFSGLDDLNGANKSGNPTQNVDLPKAAGDLADKYSQAAGVDSRYIRALIAQESSGNPQATSPTGARGLMQLTSATAKQYGVDRNNPEENVKGGTQYFKDLLDQYKDPKLAFAAYYSGPGAIKDGKIVSTADHTAADTTKYVNQVSDRLGLEQKTDGQQGSHNDLVEYTKTHPTMPTSIDKFMGALGASGGSYNKAFEHLLGSQDATDKQAAKDMAYFVGGADNFKKYDDYRDTLEIQRKNDQALDLSNKKAAAKETADQLAHQKKQDMVDSLETAKIPDNVFGMDSKDVIKNLQDQGVTLPPEAIRDALAIAHYDAPLSVGSNKTWFKDLSLTQQDLLDVVKTLNPSYGADNFDALKAFKIPNSKPNQTVAAAAGIANHLNDLQQLSADLASGRTNYPLINKLEGELGTQTGGSDYARLTALTNAINDEMGKVLAGGFAPDKAQVEQLMKNMTPQNSNNQIQQLSQLYTRIMHDKVAPYDEQYNQLSGAANKHMPTIPATLTKLFQANGFETPWESKRLVPPKNANASIPQGYNAMTKDGKWARDAKTQQWVQLKP